MTGRIPIDDILGAGLDEASSEIVANFKKTVLIRDYETEVIEATSSIKIDHPINGTERMFISIWALMHSIQKSITRVLITLETLFLMRLTLIRLLKIMKHLTRTVTIHSTSSMLLYKTMVVM